MTTKQFEEFLLSAIRAFPEESDASRVRTFEEAGVLTHDRGLVVTLRDGGEIQVTLVCSRLGRDDR